MLTAAHSVRAPGPGSGPQDGIDHIDHLFLLPVRVLSMDSASLRKDLAGLDFNVHLLHNGPQGNVWLCKSAPGPRPPALTFYSARHRVPGVSVGPSLQLNCQSLHGALRKRFHWLAQ